MPKDVIHPSIPDGDGPRVEVGWQRDMGVQLAVIGQFETARRYLDEQADNALERFGFGFHANLDRGQINRTIRALRRARDQAYGRDE